MAGAGIDGNGGVTLTNQGKVFGTDHGVHVFGAGDEATIINRGDMFGGLGGVTASSGGHSNVKITNSGLLDSDQYGIWLLNAPGAKTTISNSGIIRGDVNAIRTESGDRIALTNTGSLLGHIRATSVNQADSITNNGRIAGTVFLGSGNDTYAGSGTVSGIVFGEVGTDRLTGGKSADRLDGGPGNDTLIGGLGKDTLTGGADSDTFRFTAKTHSLVGANADGITDFDDGGTGDRIDVSALFGPAMIYRHNLAFTAVGQVRINDVAGPDVVVELNIGGTLAPDFSIRLLNTTLASTTKTDFIL